MLFLSHKHILLHSSFTPGQLKVIHKETMTDGLYKQGVKVSFSWPKEIELELRFLHQSGPVF